MRRLMGLVLMVPAAAFAWQPAPSAGTGVRMLTEWGERLTPETAWREYPRPQLVRDNWTCLNGLWDYAVTAVTNTPGRPTAWDGKILVPFAIESQLSGVGRLMEPDEMLWYTRKIQVRKESGHRLLLHFDGVDFRAMVFIGHREVTDVPHEGAQEPFMLDVTDFVKDGENDLTVAVWDPTEGTGNSRGKQCFRPVGCFYTRCSGIWQSVWLESVPEAYVKDYNVVPDIDAGTATFAFELGGVRSAAPVRVQVTDGGKVIAEGVADAAGRATVTMPKGFGLWSPESPRLYGFRAEYGADAFTGYFAMRKFAKGKDAKGVLRFFLNNRPYYILGTLDQGWWPDGLLTPPSEEAMANDIRVLKDCGFNMMRKHIKVEPRRYYALCDRLGLLVLQDLPSWNGDPNSPYGATAVRGYGFQRHELKAMVDNLRKTPSIVMWVPYNEGWSQPGAFLTHSTLDWVKNYDPSRLVNGPSGYQDFEGGCNWRGNAPHRPAGVCEAGDTIDRHDYRGPSMLPLNDRRISFLGEYGGLGHPVDGHLWIQKVDAKAKWGSQKKTQSWGYGGIEDTKTREGLEKTYLTLADKLAGLAAKGLAGSVYTQTTDVEIEINGLMTYDRKVLKFDPAKLRAAHEKVIRAGLCCIADAAISDELASALEPVGRALAARRFASPFGPAPTAQDNGPAAIAYYLSKGLDGKLADAKVLTNDSASEDKDVWLGDRMFRLPPKGWVAVSADGRAGSMNVRLNRQRFMAGWCDDYTVWVKDGKIGLRNLNLTRGVVVRADGDPTRPRKLGEESAFAVEVRDEAGNLRTDGTVTVFADNCGAKKLLGETRFDLAAANPFTVRAKMDEPGFLRLTARLEKPAKSATATVPYAPEGIRPGTARPDDFDAVWAADLRRAEETVPLDPRREEVTGAYGGALKEYSVSFATTEGRRVYGYMTVPKAASASNKMGVVVTIVGAGPGASYAWDARDDSITLVLNVVDYLPTDANVGKDYAAMNAREKKRFGVDGYSQAGWTAKREKVFFHSQLIGLVRGLKWVAQLPEVDAHDFTYFGGSQGGGCGMAVVALSDGLFRKAFLYITAMSDMLRADVGGRDGWPGVRRYASDADALAAVKRNAPYFDACSFARRVRCPVRSTLGLEDTTCPPPNVMASFNELASKDRKIDFEPRIGHGISGLRFASIYEWLRAKDDDEFRLAWTGRRIFDAELPFPDGATFLPHGHYRAEVTSLPASMRFADASGKTALEFAAPTNFTPPYVMHVGLSGRHNALVCVEQPNAAPKVVATVPMPLKTFDPSVQENLTKIRVEPVGGMGAVAMTQSAGLGQADVRFVTRGRECRPYVEDGRVFFTFSVRYYSGHLGVGSIDPARPEDGWRFEGTILFDYGDGRYANDVAAHLWLDDESGEWRAWTSNFSTAGRDADGKPVKRASGGISVAVSKTSPLHGFNVMRSRTLGLSGMNEDPSGCWDARAKRWRLLVSAFTPNGIKAQMLESDRWDGGFKALTGTVPEDSTGTTIARMNGDFACLAGSVDRAYYVYSYPMLAKLGTLALDKTPWGDKTGWPHGRGWPAYLEVEKDGVLRKLLLTMDRENYPGMPNPNWTYGALFLYRAN